MGKADWANVVFLLIEVIAFAGLTMEVFGAMNPDALILSAIAFGVGMTGNCVLTLARVIRKSKKQ